jgi:hypothetical protein
MPRFTRFAPLIALLALPLVSCFTDVGDCPTCPGDNSASIDVLVTQTGLVDSIHVSMDGGSQVTVRRNRRHVFENLSRGTHQVTITRWFFLNEILSSRTSSLQIRLEPGESRTIVFHNDFPLVAWGPAPAAKRLAGLPVRPPATTRVG